MNLPRHCSKQEMLGFFELSCIEQVLYFSYFHRKREKMETYVGRRINFLDKCTRALIFHRISFFFFISFFRPFFSFSRDIFRYPCFFANSCGRILETNTCPLERGICTDLESNRNVNFYWIWMKMEILILVKNYL